MKVRCQLEECKETFQFKKHPVVDGQDLAVSSGWVIGEREDYPDALFCSKHCAEHCRFEVDEEFNELRRRSTQSKLAAWKIVEPFYDEIHEAHKNLEEGKRFFLVEGDNRFEEYHVRGDRIKDEWRGNLEFIGEGRVICASGYLHAAPGEPAYSFYRFIDLSKVSNDRS